MAFPFKPRTDGDQDDRTAQDAPAFAKRNFGNKRKNRKIAPTQKHLMAGSKPKTMAGGRSMSGGGR